MPRTVLLYSAQCDSLITYWVKKNAYYTQEITVNREVFVKLRGHLLEYTIRVFKMYQFQMYN